MYEESVRSTTAGTGKTLLAIVAILSLLLSLFAITQPVAADHGGFDHQPLPIDSSTFDQDADECEGADLEPGQVLMHWIANQQNTIEPITLTLTIEGMADPLVLTSYKWNDPGTIDSNVTHHFETVVTGDVVITNLDISTNEGNVRLSHVCRGEESDVDDSAALNIHKQDGEGNMLEGAVFEIRDVEGMLLTDTDDTPDTFETNVEGEICITGLPADAEFTVTELQAPDGFELADPATQSNVPTDDDGDCNSPDATFVNLPSEGGEQPGETVTVSIMKHLCTDVSTVEEFEAVEDAGVAGIAGGQGTLSGLAATVLACPTIVLTGDVPTSGAVSAGNVDFDFTVVDADGTQVLSSDGDFEQASLCEADLDVDVNGDGDKNDCLDTSHYMFEVVDGTVVVTETDEPEGSTGVGTLRFTPGSEDETALVGTIGDVEATGAITLDTSKASETALDDGMIMLHVYNFAEAGTTPNQGGGGGNEGTKGNQGGPRQGTLAGNLPNTATEPFNGTSMPAALVALLMLSGLGAAAYAMKAEAVRRR